MRSWLWFFIVKPQNKAILRRWAMLDCCIEMVEEGLEKAIQKRLNILVRRQSKDFLQHKPRLGNCMKRGWGHIKIRLLPMRFITLRLVAEKVLPLKIAIESARI